LAAGQEIERKFLVASKPTGLGEGTPIRQGYLPLDIEDVELRVREKGEARVLTVKSGHGQSRDEQEAEIGTPAFEALWPLTEGRRIEKTRYEIEHGELTIELDEYGGDLEGLLVAEIEFDSEDEAERFEPPGWLGRELTGDERYSNAALAERGVP
jgi:CYTH domain-containing protein